MASDRRVAVDVRGAADVGRRARLELRFAVRNGRTSLVHAYAEPPFRVGRSFQEPDGGVHMIMASSAPGVFGGDVLETTIHVEAGARVRLTSQSALQGHPSRTGEPAVLRNRYLVGDDAALACEWDPMIPFAGSRLDQRFDIDIASSARLYWSDAFMAGREARGERWLFASLAHELRLVREKRLEYLERFRLGEGDAPSGAWLAADACYFGSTLLSSGADATVERAETIQALLHDGTNVSAAADLVADGLLLVRLMSPDGPAFHKARERLTSSSSE